MLSGILVCVFCILITVGAAAITYAQDKKDHVNGW